MSSIKNLIIYHRDLDGVCSAAIVSKFLGDAPKKFLGLNYSEGFPMKEIDENTDVWVVDFSIYTDIIFDLHDKCHKIYWYDHHRTSDRIDKKSLPKIEGMIDVEKAACLITWEQLFQKEVPMVVKLVDDWDMWRFNQTGTKAFKSYVSLMFDDPKNGVWDLLLDNDETANKLIADFIYRGEILLLAEKKRIEKAIARGFWGTMGGYKTFFINASDDISSLGEAVYLSTSDTMIVAIYQIVNKTDIIFSLRSNQVNVRLVAEKFKGSGHDFSAGFRLKYDFTDLHKRFGNFNL